MLKIMSFNVRIDVPVDGKLSWEHRKKKVVDFIKKESPDILGLQEVGPQMLLDLSELSEIYHVYLMPRDDRGESTPIFVKKGLGVEIYQDSFWLTRTPEILSKVDHAYFPRIATYIIIYIESIGNLAVFNTHLDYASDNVSLEQSEYLIKYINDLKQNYEFSTIVMGDFNCDRNSKTVFFMKSMFEDGYAKNNKELLTFHEFKLGKIGEPIDYIFHDKKLTNNHVKVLFTEEALSDHYPIVLTI